jgi:hypothetical protein
MGGKMVATFVICSLSIALTLSSSPCEICYAAKGIARCVQTRQGKVITSGCIRIGDDGETLRDVTVYSCSVTVENRRLQNTIKDKDGNLCRGKSYITLVFSIIFK